MQYKALAEEAGSWKCASQPSIVPKCLRYDMPYQEITCSAGAEESEDPRTIASHRARATWNSSEEI